MVISLITVETAYGYLIPQPDIEYPTIFNGFPDPHPTATYYAWKMAQGGQANIQLQYPLFSIEIPSVISCGDYFSINGQVPYSGGILESLAISKAEPYHTATQNYSNDVSKGLLGYLTIPCNEETLGEYDVYFVYQGTVKIFQDTIIHAVDKPIFSETVTVTVVG